MYLLVSHCADAARVSDPKAEALEAQTGTHVFRKAAAAAFKWPADAEGSRGGWVSRLFVLHVEHVMIDLIYFSCSLLSIAFLGLNDTHSAAAASSTKERKKGGKPLLSFNIEDE